MTINLYNADIVPITVEQCGKVTTIAPRETCVLNCDASFILSHAKNDKFSGFWYLANEIFSLEQMRTVLVVNGEYRFGDLYEGATVRVKSYEYVFEKNTSYETFVFSQKIYRDRLEVAHSESILKKSRFLYLFGGNKTLLPLSVVALIAVLINITSVWEWVLAGSLALCAAVMLIKYIRSLKFLKNAVKQERIFEYLNSPRREYRRPSDDITQKNLDVNAGEELYW